MTTYVLGAGASCDAGYPLAKTMGSELFTWMKGPIHAADSYAARYPGTAEFLEGKFGVIENIEELATEIQKLIVECENGTAGQRAERTVLANEYGVLKNAVRSWFAEIQKRAALSSPAYHGFARNIVVPGDCIITFNYDVLLERELKLAGKFEVGDGYGFRIETLPEGSPTKVLKLHGSTSWLALLFGGRTSGAFQFEPGNTLGPRPVIGSNELAFLGYSNSVDPGFARGGAALPVMIFPERTKQFYFAANTGIEYEGFWNDLWHQASVALRSGTRVVICGYSLNPVDERAHDLLLSAPRKRTEIVVASAGGTDMIVEEYRKAGYTGAVPADEVLFTKWVASSSNVATATR